LKATSQHGAVVGEIIDNQQLASAEGFASPPEG